MPRREIAMDKTPSAVYRSGWLFAAFGVDLSEENMRSGLILFAILLCAIEGAQAQEVTSASIQGAGGVPDSSLANPLSLQFTPTKPALGLTAPALFGLRADSVVFTATATPAPFAFTVPSSASTTASAAFADASPLPPAPDPKFVYGGRDDFRWQFALGISVVRFRSRVFYATGVGTDTSIAYFTNQWLGFEGRLTTAFSPTTYAGSIVKYVGYGGGPKIAWREKKFEPFVHALAGGIHIRPQTALGANAFEVQTGGGVGYRFNPRLSVRVGVDYVGSHLFNDWQNNAQATVDAVLHF